MGAVNLNFCGKLTRVLFIILNLLFLVSQMCVLLFVCVFHTRRPDEIDNYVTTVYVNVLFCVYGASFSRFVRWLVSRPYKTHSPPRA